MSQHDFDITTIDANTGPTMRAAINAALQALAGNNSGATAPVVTYANMWWPDTGTGVMFQRNPEDTGWISRGPLANAYNMLSEALNEAQGEDIASAATTNIGAATGNYVNITGTTTITGLGTAQAGARRIVKFSGVLTLTHNGTSLILPSAANIVTAANDVATFVSTGSGGWVCAGYQKANGQSVAPTLPTFASAAENAAGTIENKAVDPLGLREAFNATGAAPVFACRAWVNFNGTGTVAIRASGNVSSITDSGVGMFSVNTSTAMADLNFSAAYGALRHDMTGAHSGVEESVGRTSSSLKINTTWTSSASNQTFYDPEIVTVSIFR